MICPGFLFFGYAAGYASLYSMKKGEREWLKK